MCGVRRLCADMLCPLRLLWFLYPVHWGSALPIPGGHLAVLCWHGIILWLWTRSIDPNCSPGGNILRPQCSGLCCHVLLVSYTLTNYLNCDVSQELVKSDFSLLLPQYQTLPVCHLWPGIFFLPLWYTFAGWGFLRHKRREADLWRIQKHPMWPLPQPYCEQRGLRGQRRGNMTSGHCYDVECWFVLVTKSMKCSYDHEFMNYGQ